MTDEAVPNRTINAIDFGGRQNRLNYPVIPAVLIQRFSFSCWVRVLGQPDGATSGTIFEHFQTTPESRHTFRLLLSSGGGRFLHSRRDATSTQTTRGQFNDGAWHHAVLTVAGSDVKIYVDGFEEPVEPSTVGYPSANENSFGWQDSGAVASVNTLADWRFYDRVISAEEVRSIYNDGLFNNNDSVSDYYARWNPSVIDSVQVADSGPNGIHATWDDYDRRAYISADGVDPVNGLVSLYAIGDSLTEDADPETLLPITAKLINEGQPLSFHLANPTISTEISSLPWDTALNRQSYDVLMIQPFPASTAQPLADDVLAIQTWMDLQPDSIVLIHEGFPPLSTAVETTERFNEPFTGNFAYSDAYFRELVNALKEANPTRDIRRSRTMEFVYTVAERITSGLAPNGLAVGGSGVDDGLYRDGFRINPRFGSFAIHNCCRQALGLPIHRYGGFAADSVSGQVPLVAEYEAYVESLIVEIFRTDVEVSADLATPIDTSALSAATAALNDAISNLGSGETTALIQLVTDLKNELGKVKKLGEPITHTRVGGGSDTTTETRASNG